MKGAHTRMPLWQPKRVGWGDPRISGVEEGYKKVNNKTFQFIPQPLFSDKRKSWGPLRSSASTSRRRTTEINSVNPPVHTHPHTHTVSVSLGDPLIPYTIHILDTIHSVDVIPNVIAHLPTISSRKRRVFPGRIHVPKRVRRVSPTCCYTDRPDAREGPHAVFGPKSPE